MPATVRLVRRSRWLGLRRGPPLDRARLPALLGGARVTPAPDRSRYDACGAARPSELWRARRPDDDGPWCTLQWVPSGDGDGELHLAASLTDPGFERNWRDLLAQAPRLAAATDADALDDRDRPVDPEALAARFATAHRAAMGEAARAWTVPLEFALGGVLDAQPVRFVAETTAPGALARATAAGSALVRVEERDGAVRIGGAYRGAPFAEWAAAVLALAQRVDPAAILLGFGPLREVLAEVEPRIGGLGCEFVDWARARAGPAG